MSQLSISEKVRLLYDNIKDIKYALATYVDMSDKELGQYSEVILTNLGTQGSNKTAGNLKIRSTPIETPTNFGFAVEAAGISAIDLISFETEIVTVSITHNILVCDLDAIEAVVADVEYVGTIGSIEIVKEPIDASTNFGIIVEPAGITAIDYDNPRIEPVIISITHNTLLCDLDNIRAIITDVSYVGTIGSVEIRSTPVEVPIVYNPQEFVINVAPISASSIYSFNEFNIEAISSDNIIQKDDSLTKEE